MIPGQSIGSNIPSCLHCSFQTFVLFAANIVARVHRIAFNAEHGYLHYPARTASVTVTIRQRVDFSTIREP